ncbi:MAG: hypothetical protein NC916_01625 [Candidatus Omnitrophica bacterium]|nr:hypothetical protein [Candidatus Omnitrophota bacterium]
MKTQRTNSVSGVDNMIAELFGGLVVAGCRENRMEKCPEKDSCPEYLPQTCCREAYEICGAKIDGE